jgi:hypothetical protein
MNEFLIQNQAFLGANNANNANMTDPEKQKKLELITYVKAHLDLVAVTAVIAYMAITIIKMSKKNK